jgi:hypothetical protein
VAKVYIILRVTDDYVGEIDNEFIVDKKEPIKAFTTKQAANSFIQDAKSPYTSYEVVTLELK